MTFTSYYILLWFSFGIIFLSDLITYFLDFKTLKKDATDYLLKELGFYENWMLWVFIISAALWMIIMIAGWPFLILHRFYKQIKKER